MCRYDIKIIHTCLFGFLFHLSVTVFSQSQLLHLLHFINSFLIKTWWQNIEITIFYQIVTWSKPQAPDSHNKNNLKYPISNNTQGTNLRHLGFISNCHISWKFHLKLVGKIILRNGYSTSKLMTNLTKTVHYFCH